MENILLNYIQHICGAENVEVSVPLSTLTTFRIGGLAKFVVSVPTKEALLRLVSGLSFLGEKYFVLGLGANVLASDDGFDGVIIKLGFKEITYTDDFLYADAGAKLGVVCNFARDNNLSGFEWAVGIPATIGGAIYMNAGAFGKSMSDLVVMVDILENGELKTLPAGQIKYGYRDSVFQKKKCVILGAYFHLKRLPDTDETQTAKEQTGKIQTAKEKIAADMKAILAKRANHPKEPSAGSIFKRPFDGFYVGKIIEDLGLKGKQIGGAKISEKHAGFIINDVGNGNSATAKDVMMLIEEIRVRVKEKTGVLLDPEIVVM